MKLTSVATERGARAVAVVNDHIIDLVDAEQDWLGTQAGAGAPVLTPSLLSIIEAGDVALRRLRAVLDFAEADTAAGIPLGDARFIRPFRPPKIVCTGTNYEDYRRLIGIAFSPVPLIFIKSSDATIGHEETILLPEGYGVVYHEWELSCVIGRTCRHAPPDRVADYIFGYTIVNDITGRSLEATNRELQPLGKNIDTFAPFGPWIVTGDAMPADLYNLKTLRRRNGVVECESSTAEMRLGFAEIVAYVSNFMTLHPGDIVTTATPPAGPIEPGDLIEAEIEGVGILRNRVAEVAVDTAYAQALELDPTAV